LAAQPAADPRLAVVAAAPPAGADEFTFPDLVGWASHLDPRHRVLVLDLQQLPGLDELAALELRALQRHHHDERRHLVVCGLGPEHVQALDDAGVLLDFDADDLCRDRLTAELRAAELVATA
jgi:hypothetical protein